jgi:cyclopropane-fatty-acyl-phospholipid synthase
MIDHPCSPEQAREGKAVDIYRAYFQEVLNITTKCLSLVSGHPGCTARRRCGLSAYHAQGPREDYFFCTKEIFPGLEPAPRRCCPGREPLLRGPRVPHAPRGITSARRARVAASPPLKREKTPAGNKDKVYDDYDRYLGTCVRARSTAARLRNSSPPHRLIGIQP